MSYNEADTRAKITEKFSINNDQDLTTFGIELSKLLLEFPDWKIVGIDGAMQSGKSALITKFIAEHLNAKILDLDSFINIDETSIIFKNLLIDPNTKYIADGILNREILDYFNVSADLNIYVKKMANYGWTERDWLDKELVAEYGLDTSFQSSNIDRQIYRYHNEYNPVENANIILEISEEHVTKDFAN